MADNGRLHPSADVYPLALEVGGIAVWDWDPISDTAVWSPMWGELLGWPVDELPTSFEGSLDLVHPEDRPILEHHLGALLDGGDRRQAEYRLRRSDDSWRRFRGSACTVLDEAGQLSQVVLVVVNSTAEHRALEEAERRRRLEEVGRRSAARLISADGAEIESAVRSGLQDFAKLLGATRSTLILADELAGSFHDRVSWSASESSEDTVSPPLAHYPWLAAELSAGRTVSVASRDELPADADAALRQRLEELSVEAVLLVPVVVDGEMTAAVRLVSDDPVDWPAEAAPILGAFSDSCVQALRRHRLEVGLRVAHGHLQHLVDRSPVKMWKLGVDNSLVVGDFGDEGAVAGRSFQGIDQSWTRSLHPDDFDTTMAGMAQALAGQEVHYENRFRHGDGHWLTFESFLRPVIGTDGSTVEVLGYSIDITDRKIAEEQRRAAQRLEAIGQLAGGVAHDFNNLLTVIHGYIEIARQGEISALDEAMVAAERARDLVEQLLTFSRQRDVEVASVDLNTMIRALHRMVDLISADIELECVLADDLPPVSVDVVQLEQAILNLAVNARDAMLDGGTLTLRTDMADPLALPAGLSDSHYVRLRVADTGSGMTSDVAAHAFDPFFTTKSNGHGTGLGLPSVHGAVTSVGGTVRLSTAPGRGSTFELFLPVATQAPEPREIADLGTTESATEATVLVVDDQPQVGDLAVSILQRAGHRVLVAADGATALELAQGRHLDLVVTDVAMPRMTGPELAAALRVERPDLMVVFMSGYTGESLPTDDRSWFLQKPFTLAQLTDITTRALNQTTH